MLDLIGDASAYLSAPAERSRWQDTWTMKRTRREAMTALGHGYASWLRTAGGVGSTVVLLGGAFLLGRGMTAVAGGGGALAVLTAVGAVVLLLVGLAAAGYVLFTGTQVVGALRAWSRSRGQDGGPGVGLVLTPAVIVRLVLALVAVAAGLALVLVRTGVLTIEVGLLGGEGQADPGQALWQWFAAVIAIAGGLAAASGAVRAGLAVRRRPGRPTAPGPAAAAQQQYGPQSGHPPQSEQLAPATAGPHPPEYTPHSHDTWQAGYALPPEQVPPEQAPPIEQAPQGVPNWGDGYAPQADDTWQAGYALPPDQAPPLDQVPPLEQAPQGVPSWGDGYAPQADDTWQPGYAPQPGPDPQQAEPAQQVQEHPPPSPYAPQQSDLPAAEDVPPSAQPEEAWADTRKASDLPTVAPPLPVLRAVLPDGRTIAGEGLTLLGRSPAGRSDEPIVESVAVPDSGVSKTHLAVRMDNGRVWATDRASTNGTILIRDGHQESLTPWQEVSLAAGDQLVVGHTTLRIETAE